MYLCVHVSYQTGHSLLSLANERKCIVIQYSDWLKYPETGTETLSVVLRSIFTCVF